MSKTVRALDPTLDFDPDPECPGIPFGVGEARTSISFDVGKAGQGGNGVRSGWGGGPEHSLTLCLGTAYAEKRADEVQMILNRRKDQ